MRKIDKIIIHHSASDGKTTTPEIIKSWHLERGMKDIGYHYLIGHSGEIFKGRQEIKIGAHCKGQNANSIGVCVIGNFENDFPTLNQSVSIRSLIESLSLRFPEAKVSGHKENAPTLCPGRNLQKYLEDLRK